MKSSVFVVGLFAAFSAGQVRAAFITSYISNIRFVDAAPGVQMDSEPLRFGVDAGDRVALLDLGEYSKADAGKTFTFMRQPANEAEWDAFVAALREAVNTGREQMMWLGLETNDFPRINYLDFLAGDPDYNLQRIDITLQYYSTGNDDGNSFRTAGFLASLYWQVIPEPMNCVPLLNVLVWLITFRRRG